jgi:6-phosphogluconolactonase (cycloisomerase 2 family)
MNRYTKFVVCMIATLWSAVAFAQVSSIHIATPSGKSPVAYVYVANSPNGKKIQIDGYAAASNGKLSRISGSPFPGNVGYIAVNASYLFGTDGVYIYSFSIAPDGSLKQVSSINAQQHNRDNYGGPRDLFLDRTGATLYDSDLYCCGDGNTYQFFGIDNSTGKLTYLGVSDQAWDYWVPMSFLHNNKYVYGAQCNGNMYWSIYGFTRNSDGTLTNLNKNFSAPKAKPGDFNCPYLTSANPTNHVAISVQAVNGSTFGNDGPPQLATYTADSSGNLTTKSTYQNMPATAVKGVSDIAMSPSGELVAVSGAAGLQAFHFNGSKPITHYTGLLTKNEIDQVFWDNDNHLYAISTHTGKLFVFTITPTSFHQAPGSPYTIANPLSISVLPKS